MSSTIRTILETRLTRYETMLEAAYDAMDAAADGMHIDKYELDTGEGRQAVWAASPKKIEEHIMWLEAQIRHINQRLNGQGVVNLTMKRKY